jgi:hypothetical protein
LYFYFFLHWFSDFTILIPLEYPAHFEKNKADFIRYKATIFRDCEEGLLLYWLFTEQFDIMASKWVDLEDKMTHDEKKALMLKRLRATLKEFD